MITKSRLKKLELDVKKIIKPKREAIFMLIEKDLADQNKIKSVKAWGKEYKTIEACKKALNVEDDDNLILVECG